MSRAFITLDDVRLSAPDRVADAFDDEAMSAAIDAACAAIERATGRMILSGDVTALHSGALQVRRRDGACELYLADPATGLALTNVTAVATIEEDGTALTAHRVPTETSFTPDAEVALIYERTGIVVRAVTDASGRLAWKAWSTASRLNIKTTVTAGWGLGSAPDDLVRLAVEWTWLVYREGGRVGLEQWTVSDVTARFARLLSPQAKQTLALWRIPRSPRTMEA